MKISKGVNTFAESPPQILSTSVKGWQQMKKEHCQSGEGQMMPICPDSTHEQNLGVTYPASSASKHSSSCTGCSVLASAWQWSSDSAIAEQLQGIDIINALTCQHCLNYNLNCSYLW